MQPERLDVLDAQGNRTGRTVVRGTTLQPDEYHLAVHVWIRNAAGAYLIQQRAFHLADGPGVWATTVGYVLAGEDSRSAAMRETQEELGLLLEPNALRHWQRLTTGWRIQDVWLAEALNEAQAQVVIGPEVAAVLWATKPEIATMIARGAFFGYSYFAELPG